MQSRRARQPEARENLQWVKAYVTELVTGHLIAAPLGVQSGEVAWKSRGSRATTGSCVERWLAVVLRGGLGIA